MTDHGMLFSGTMIRALTRRQPLVRGVLLSGRVVYGIDDATRRAAIEAARKRLAEMRQARAAGFEVVEVGR